MVHLILALVAAWQVTGAIIRHHDAQPCHLVKGGVGQFDVVVCVDKRPPLLLLQVVRWHLETGVGTNLDCWRLE